MSTGERDTSEVLSSLQAKGDHFAKQGVVEKKRLNDLEDAILHITTETAKYRAKAKKAAIDVMNLHILTPNPAYQRADGVSVGKDADRVTKKVLNILETKYDKLKQRRSEIDIQNAKLKEEVNHMRMLRLQTDTAHSKFDRQMAATKSKIEKLLSSANECITQRESLLELKESLEAQNVEEQKRFEDEYEDMGKYIKEQNTALEDALLKDRKDGNKNKGNSDTGNQEHVGLITAEEEDEMAGRVGVLASFVQSESDSLKNVQKTIMHYEQMFEELRQMTEKESLEEVINSYTKDEEEMFSLYNYCQALNSEIETVTENTHRVESEIEAYKNDQEVQDEARRKALGSLEGKLKVIEDGIFEAEERNRESAEYVEQIAKKVQSLFFKLQCDQMDQKSTGNQQQKGAKGTTMNRPESKVALLTGGQGGVTESNVLDYMAVIEQRAVDIITDYLRYKAYFDATLPRSPTPAPVTKRMNTLETKKDVSINLDMQHIENDENDMDEEEDKPVDLSTFKEKLQKKLTDTSSVATSNGSFNSHHKRK